jgi:hypothetical protein
MMIMMNAVANKDREGGNKETVRIAATTLHRATKA